MYRKLIGACVGLAMMGMAGTANALLIVVGGELQGATNVDVNGTLFDVEFLDGTCVGLFSGCDATTDFAFDTQAAATAAAQSLLDNVLLDGVAPDLFDTDPELTRGCTSSGLCDVYLPYDVDGVTVATAFARNFSTTDSTALAGISISSDFSFGGGVVYAVFTQVDDVQIPEPSTLAFFATGLALLAFLGWRRRSVQVKAA